MEENKNEIMNEEFTADEYYTLTDEDGNELQFELIAKAEFKGTQYFAFVPADGDQNDEFCEYVILKEVVDGEDVSLVSIDDNEEEFNAVADIFDNLFDEEVDYDAPKK